MSEMESETELDIGKCKKCTFTTKMAQLLDNLEEHRDVQLSFLFLVGSRMYISQEDA
ncbi:hypothetical protein MTR_0999s0010 [Medicago truncatula]|uniref:Uncharacterized protein n=1 Tax=Medicago truncatula TaxID=3880 RepID=A0A072TDJ1_MEDTR|nr:hypothetical protein MTR_0999s0010 [Medicago truncatula]